MSKIAMFRVVQVSHRCLFSTSVVLCADVDMSATREKLGLDRMGAPAVRRWVLLVKAGETFNISARRSAGFHAGDFVSLEQVSNKLPISLKWRAAVST